MLVNHWLKSDRWRYNACCVSIRFSVLEEGGIAVSPDLHNEQTILENARPASLSSSIQSFLIDRQAEGLSRYSVKFYRQNLHPFRAYCSENGVTLVQGVTPDLLRGFFLKLAETHNPGGVHGYYRSVRALFRWLVLEEIMPPEWRNPMLNVKPPKVNLAPLEPISLEDVRALIDTCERGTFAGERDRAVLLFLLDTGVRAQEACNVRLDDVDLNTGQVIIRYGKGGKSRVVFLGRTTRRAVRAHLRTRNDHCPGLFVSRWGDYLSYDGLRQLLERRWKRARLAKRPSLHNFRRAFALNMLRNGVDVFALQRLLGHSDLQIMRRYLAQNDTDIKAAHMRGSPVDNGL
jgi:integrase/recombinase XerD